MAFLSKVGNILKQTKLRQSDVKVAAVPFIYQAIRCMSSSKLFIGGLSYGTDEQGLREAFAKYGEVIEARVIMDRESGRSRGFGFVTYTSNEDASSAIQALDGQDLHGRRVRVNYATDRQPRYGGGGYNQSGYGGGGYGGGGYDGGNYGGGGYGGGGYAGGGGGGYNTPVGGDSYGTGGNYGGGSSNFGGGNYGVSGPDSFSGAGNDGFGNFGGGGDNFEEPAAGGVTQNDAAEGNFVAKNDEDGDDDYAKRA